MQHRPRKRFGQHFLHDPAIIDAIVRTIAPQPGQRMVEIGPGLAALTLPLAAQLGHLTVIEVDRNLAARLRPHRQLEVIETDVLKVDVTQLARTLAAPKIRLVGNLPYNISSPILFHLMEHVHAVEDQHFMLQKEVVERMVAAPDTAAYGRLSVMLQWRYSMQKILNVPPWAFEPPPRVESAVVRMQPHAAVPAVNEVLFKQLVQIAFSQRRKLLRHTLGHWLQTQDAGGRAAVPEGHFDLQRRAGEVPVAEYLALAQSLSARSHQPLPRQQIQ